MKFFDLEFSRIHKIFEFLLTYRKYIFSFLALTILNNNILLINDGQKQNMEK